MPVEDARQTCRKNLEKTIQTTLIPVLKTIRKEQSAQVRNTCLDIVENQLLELDRERGKDKYWALMKLTPMGMRVCRFLRSGASTKEIADALNLSIVTIQTHRRSIRNKLGIKNRKINLITFLNQAEHLDDASPGSERENHAGEKSGKRMPGRNQSVEKKNFNAGK